MYIFNYYMHENMVLTYPPVIPPYDAFRID